MTNENPGIPGERREGEGPQRLLWQNILLVCDRMCVRGSGRGVVVKRIDKVKHSKGDWTARGARRCVKLSPSVLRFCIDCARVILWVCLCFLTCM